MDQSNGGVAWLRIAAKFFFALFSEQQNKTKKNENKQLQNSLVGVEMPMRHKIRGGGKKKRILADHWNALSERATK